MPEIVFTVLRYFFLFLLYLFVILVVVTVYRELVPAPQRQRTRRAAAVSRSRRGAGLVLLDVEGRRRREGWEITGELVIGRAPQCSVCLKDEFASNLHAKIYQMEGRYYVEDLGSTNGTYVNGRRINYPTELRPGDRIKIGRTLLEFRG